MPLHTGPLTDYVPAAGLEWLVAVDLSAVLTEPLWRRALDRSVPQQDRRRFASDFGIDPTRASSLAIAGYGFGTLYLAEARGQAAAAEEAFRTRARGVVGVDRPHQRVVMLTALIDGKPVRLTSVRGSLVALAIEDPTLARVVTLYALERIDASPPALRSAALKGIPPAFHFAPIRAYLLGPIEPGVADADASLVHVATALAISAAPRGDEVRLEVLLGGSWRAAEDLPALRTLWDRLASSPLGRLTRLDDPVAGPEFRLQGDWLTVRVTARAEPLLAGIQAAVDAEMAELFSEPGPAAVIPSDRPENENTQ